MFRKLAEAEAKHPPAPKFVQLVLSVAAAFAIVTLVPVFTGRMGVMFVPDPIITAAWHPWLIGLAITLGLIVFVALMVTPPRGGLFQVLRIVAPSIYVGIFYVGLTTSLPLVWTTFTGQPSVKVVTVAHPTGVPTSRCFPAVQLQSLPIMSDRLCNVPPRMAMKMLPGDKVLLLGHGSSLGMFYQEARLLPSGTEL